MTTGVGRGGFVRVQGKHLAVGYLGRYSGTGVDARIRGDQSIFKMLKAHIDKVLGVGLAADLWHEIPQSAILEATPIPGVAIAAFSHRTPTGAGTLVLTVAGAARTIVWTPPGGTAAPTVDVRAGGIFKLESSGSYLTVSIDSAFLPSSGGPYSNSITFSRSLLHTPNFNPQVDQTTVTNAVYPLCSCYKQTSKQPDGKCRSCVSGDTRVFVRGRGLVAVEDLVGEPFEVWSGKAWRRATAFQTGIRETMTVTTNWGLSIRATPDHFIRMAERGWLEVGDLEEGDRLDFAPPEGESVSPLPVPIAAVSDLTARPDKSLDYKFPDSDGFDVGLLLGYVLGDGSVGKGKYPIVTVCSSIVDRADLDHLQEVVHGWCGTQTEVIERKWDRQSNLVLSEPAPMATVSWRIKGLADFLGALGLDKRADPAARRAPAHIFGASVECVRGFLSGLFSTDGSVGGAGGRVSLSLASVSYPLLQDVQLLLMGLGIRSTIHEYKATWRSERGYRRLYALDISALAHVQAFQTRVGFFNARKSAKLAACIDQAESTRAARRGPEPVVQRKVPFVRSVERNDVLEPVYDLTVEEDHQFVANGVTVHNCYGTGIVPGYTKFGYHELHVASIDPAVTLVGTSLFTEFQPYRLQIATGLLTATITSPVFTIGAPGVVASVNPFQFRVDSYIRQPAGTSVLVEVSINAGPYVSIATLPSLSVAAGGTIQLRVTLTRALVTDKSPFFEIARIRYPRLDEPFIRVLKGLPTKTRERGGMGVVDSDGNHRWWTVPLRHFDDLVAQDPDVVVPPEVNLIQQKAFIEFREGTHVGVRYDLTAFDYHDPKGIFISQGFSCRRPQRDEMIGQVF